MAEDTAQQDLNAIVQAIGFGIVGDFRELRQAMYGISAEMEESNRLLGSVNQNLEATGRALDALEKDVYRQVDSRQFKQLENQLEAKNRQSMRRNDEIMRNIMGAVSDIKRQAAGVRVKIDSEGRVTRQETGGDGSGAPDLEPRASGGSFLGSAGKIAGAVIGGVALAGLAGAAYAMSGDSSGAQEPANPPSTPPVAPPLPTENTPPPAAPAPAAAPAAPPPPAAPNLTPTPAATQASAKQSAVPPAPNLTPAVSTPKTNVNLTNASQTVGAIATTAKSKALAKVQTKAANWFSRNGGRIVNTIGSQYLATFGGLVGGRFSFNKYVSDDSWTNLGLAYVNGQPLPDTSSDDPNATYVAQVIVNLAVQAYLIAREIYTQENATEITNGLVPNFDEVEESDRRQVVKNVGAALESYVNFLTEKAKSGSAQSSIQPPTPPDTGAGNLAPLAGGGQQGANMAGAAGGGGDTGGGGGSNAAQNAPQTGGGGSPNAAAAYASQKLNGGGSPQLAQGSIPGPDIQAATPADTPSASGYQPQDVPDATASPSDTTASFNTSSNQAAGVEGTRKAAGGKNFDAMVAAYGPRLMQEYGLTPVQAAAILGNLGHESVGMTAGIQEKNPRAGRGGLGWAQWTGPRRRNFEKYLKDTGQNAADPEANYGFLKYELDHDYARSIKALKKQNDFQSAVVAFEQSYEGAGVKAYGSRASYGKKALAVLGAQDQQQTQPGSDTQKTADTQTDQTAEVPAAAAGAVITPLPSDKISSNMSNALAPGNYEIAASYGKSEDSIEDDVTSSMTSIDARPKRQGPNPYDEAKNKISHYSYLMSHHFGHLKNDMQQAQEEVTSDEYHFGKALDPLA